MSFIRQKEKNWEPSQPTTPSPSVIFSYGPALTQWLGQFKSRETRGSEDWGGWRRKERRIKNQQSKSPDVQTPWQSGRNWPLSLGPAPLLHGRPCWCPRATPQGTEEPAGAAFPFSLSTLEGKFGCAGTKCSALVAFIRVYTFKVCITANVYV
jgi:hypothetical protein